jgi:iron-sulfur cluster insertion protein
MTGAASRAAFPALLARVNHCASFRDLLPTALAKRVTPLYNRLCVVCPPGRQGIRRMISITSLAATKVKDIAQSEGLDGQGLRLRVIGGGCAGFQYDLYFEDKPTDMDETFESNGVKLYIDPLSYQYLDGTEIDYVEGVHGSGFKFGNPNVSGTCGCGSSFHV